MANSPAWTRKEGKNSEGGLNEKGRASLRAAGHDIKRPQPEGGSRRDSFCARMKGMKEKLTSSETANDPDSRINKSLRKWNCHADGGAIDIARQYRDAGGRTNPYEVLNDLMKRKPQRHAEPKPVEDMGPNDPMFHIQPEEYHRGNLGLGRYVLAKGGKTTTTKPAIVEVPTNSADLMAKFGPIEQKYGLPQGFLMGMMGIESSYGTNQQRPGSQFSGAFQMSPQLQKKYGVTNKYDWVQNADAAAHYAADNAKIFKSRVGRDPSAGELYGLHQQGPYGYSGLAKNPDISAARALMIAAPGQYKTLASAVNAIKQNVPDEYKKQAGSMTSKDFMNFYQQKFTDMLAGPDKAGQTAIAKYYEANPTVQQASTSGTQTGTGTPPVDPRLVYQSELDKYNQQKAAYDKWLADYMGNLAAQGKPLIAPPQGTGPQVMPAPDLNNIATQLAQVGAGGNVSGSTGVNVLPGTLSNPAPGAGSGIGFPSSGWQAPGIGTTGGASVISPIPGSGMQQWDYRTGEPIGMGVGGAGSIGGAYGGGSPSGFGGGSVGGGGFGLSFFKNGGAVHDAVDIARSYRKAGGPVWDKPRPKHLGKPEKLSPSEKSSAKAAAKAAGRPYPNLVDNMRAAREGGGRLSPFMEAKIEEIGDKELGKYGLGPNAPASTKDELKAGPEQSTWESIASKAMGDRPSPERRRFVEGAGNIADIAHLGSYATPLAPYVGAADFARGVASGDPMEAALGATGLPGKGAKAVGVAASTMMPESAEAGPLAKALNAIRAYHGSPHKFDKFDISKIGTGEGAQAYGHGLYFAQSEPVAKSYRDALTDPSLLPLQFKGRPVDTVWNNEISDRWKDVVNNMPSSLEEDFQTVMGNLSQVNDLSQIKHIRPSLDRRQNNILDKYVLPELSKPEIGPGHMYEVDIHADPSHMLDWDRPLSEQSRHVIDRFNDAVSPVRDADDEILRELFGDKSAHASLNLFDRSKGSQAYRTFADERGGAPIVSERLKEAGIPGIKYLDQGSRGAGEGTSNYVVFDPNIIEILRRYKEGGRVEAAGGGGILKAVKDALLALHNMKSHRLDMVEKLGGLPVPSIAIGKPEHGFRSFGDITLVGGKEMATPSRLNPVFASDVYSPRFPSIDEDTGRIFRGYTPSGSRRYAPVTMENVLREMKGNIRGGENYNYGAGNVRASVTPQFKTLKDVQNARDKIISGQEFKPHKEAANAELFELADRFRPYSRYSNSSFGHAGSFAETLSDVGKGRHSAWGQDYENLPDELKSEAMQYLTRLRNMPTEYFEAKPQRAVELGEFSGAVVPENIMKDVEPRLRNLGVREIVPFKPEEEGGQQKALREFSGLHFNKGGRAKKPAKV